MKGVGIAFNKEADQSSSQIIRSWDQVLDQKSLLLALCVFVGYYLGAKLGFALRFHPHPVSVLWPPNSVLVAALLLCSPRRWWILLLAALPAHVAAQFQDHVPPAMVFCWYVSNCCEALIGATGVRLLLHSPMRFNQLRNVVAFCFCVAFLAPLLSSFLDAGFVIWNRWGQGTYWEIWRIRFTSNILAALTVAPLLVTWATEGRALVSGKSARRVVEAALLFAALLLVCWIVLYQPGSREDWYLPYLPLPFLIWAAVRFGAPGATTAIGMITFLSIWSAARGHGPFSIGSPEQNALSIQIFLIVLSVPILFLGTLIEELGTGETARQETESRFRTMADAAPVLIWMSGPDKLCTFFNKAWLDFTGRTMQQELGNGWSEGVHVDDFEGCVDTYGTAFDARKPFTIRYRLRRNDGQYRFITDTGVPRYGPGGNFRGYIGACVDVTDLLEQQRTLHEFEERIALAADAAHLGAWEMDINTKKLWMSDKARELFQFDRDGAISCDAFENRVHPEDRPARDAAVKEAIDTRRGYELEYRILLPDGTVRWIGGRARCVNDDSGSLSRLVGVSIDVTERKQAQELFQLATEASTSGILLIDGDGRIVLANAQAEKLFNYWRDELIGKPIEMLVPDRIATKDGSFRKKILNASQTIVLGNEDHVFGCRRDGSEFPAEIGLNPIRTPQGLLVLATVVDISGRRTAEETARKHREEITRLSRISLLGEMTASIAHELNQPLAGITSNANAAQRFINRGNLDPAQILEILIDIAADARRASNVIQHVRNTIKKGAALRERIDLNDIAGHVAHILQPDAHLHACDLRLSLAKDLPAIEGDPLEIQQVLINLVNNAFDAMREMPANQRKVEITTEKNGEGTVQLSVRDHGPGISDEARARMFEQFFTTKEEGLGMGLAIVRSIIEAHRGKISAENIDGDGARFYFVLPTAGK